VKPVSADDLDFWERKLEQELANDSTIRETERMAIKPGRTGAGPRSCENPGTVFGHR